MIQNYKKKEFFENLDNIKSTGEDIYYGEVNTPFNFIEEILSVIPEELYKNPDLKWLDPGCGSGNFSIVLYFKLFEGLKNKIKNVKERKKHIIENMMFMVELQSKNITRLKNIFGENANIYNTDFLQFNEDREYDVVIGNPPFNFMGQIKVPTSNSNKKNDGKTIWDEFVKKSISILKKNTGKLAVFIPSIWLKPDKKMMYNYLLQFKIEWLNCFSNTETNRIFKGKAQTPSCYFLLTKKDSDNKITIYDKSVKKYIDYHVKNNKPIPIFGQQICKKVESKELESLSKFVIKTNMPEKKVKISRLRDDIFKYKNIKTCKLNGITPELVIEYSDKPLKYHGIPKLILAHKMYGFPYLDKDGEYGISNRDNYVIIKNNIEDLKKIQSFLSTKTALYLFESTRYRMKYLEKYVFDIIPDISSLENFPEEINDDTIAEYFGLDDIDKRVIDKLHIKKYMFFI